MTRKSIKRPHTLPKKGLKIIAGTRKGQIISAPSGMITRPSHVRLKEMLFDILAHRFDFPQPDDWLLDLFAGSGAIGLEALSRGARKAVFVERSKQAVSVLKANIKHLQFEAQSHVMPIDVEKLGILSEVPKAPALVYIDPPYGYDHEFMALSRLVDGGWLDGDSLIVVEQSLDGHTEKYEKVLESLVCIDIRNSGSSRLMFHKLKSSP